MGVHHSAVPCISVQKPCMVTPLVVWHTDSINLCLWSIWMGSEDIDWPGSVCGEKYWFFILCQAKVSGLQWSVCTVWSEGFGLHIFQGTLIGQSVAQMNDTTDVLKLLRCNRKHHHKAKSNPSPYTEYLPVSLYSQAETVECALLRITWQP